MPKTNNPPGGGKRGHRSNRRWIIAALAAAVVVSIGAAAWTMRSAADPPGATAKGERLTLDPAQFNGAARQAYEVAEKDPALLAQLHCYCGCDKERP